MIELNRNQAVQLLNFFGGSEAQMVVTHLEDGHSGPGLYVYVADYPEEGALLLDPETDAEVEPWTKRYIDTNN